MSMPSDVTPDVAEAVEAIDERVTRSARRANSSVFRKISPEQYGFAAAAVIAFLGGGGLRSQGPGDEKAASAAPNRTRPSHRPARDEGGPAAGTGRA